MKPKCLDLFCGAGGAAMGLHRAGFDVTGIDIKPQPRYPFKFMQGDAMTADLEGYDFIWASPPCQRHSRTRTILKGKGLTPRGSDDEIDLIRQRLTDSRSPFIIENVPGAPLLNPIRLCGLMFDLGVIRHRMFESSFKLTTPAHPHHHGTTNSHRGYSRGGQFITVGGHNYNPEDGRKAMGIDWMKHRDGELNEAIPPAYSEFLGRQVMAFLSA